jgi:predicted negative regulator of RcsB-dependent stress response
VSYETEEQRVEAIKKWWSENGKSVIAGVVLGLGLLFGWQGWTQYRDTQREEASAIYTELTRAVENGNAAKVHEVTRDLQENYAATPYAGQATLKDAQLLADAGKLDEAQATLNWAVNNANQQVIQDLAHLNLAKIYIAKGVYEQALAELKAVEAVAYLSMVEEIRGDALRAQGDISGAREAYDRAILTAGGAASDYLHMKRDNLGDPES